MQLLKYEIFFAIFLQEHLRTTYGNHLRPLGAPELVKRGIWILDFGFEQTKVCDLILALTWPFFIGFWLRIPQNDQTDGPKKWHTPKVSLIS